MKTLEQLTAEVAANLTYDLDNSPTACRALIASLRELLLRRPRSVTVGGNPVTFEAAQDMLAKAEAWYRNFQAQDATANPNTASSRTHYYDLSDIRR